MPPVRRVTFDLDLDQVRPIVRRLDEAFSARSLSRLHGGSTEVYRIDLKGSAEPLVLKLYRDRPEWSPAKEALVAAWLDGNPALPTPRWLAVDESRSLIPMRWALTSWLPGRTVRDLMGEADVEGLYRQMGEALRRLHEVPMSAYGYILAEGVHEPAATNAAYMTRAFATTFRWFRDQGADADLARRLEVAAQRRFDLLEPSPGPVFCHDDFQPGNLLAERNAAGALQLTGLVDFGNARAADALFDLAKALMCSAHEDPRSAAPLRAGYGSLDHPDPEGALWLYTLFHRLTMWAFLVQIGDEAAGAGPAGLLRDLAEMIR